MKPNSRMRKAQRRGTVRYAWLTRTESLRARGGYTASRADEIVELAVLGQTTEAQRRLTNLETMVALAIIQSNESPQQ